MKILDTMAREGFEEVVALCDPSCGLRLVIPSELRRAAAARGAGTSRFDRFLIGPYNLNPREA